MKITFSKKTIDDAPKEYMRVRLVEEDRGVRRFVREGSITWLEIGTGKTSDMTRRRFIILCRAIVREAKKHKAKKIAVQFDRTPHLFKKMDATPAWVSRTAAENFVMANFDFRSFKTKPKDGWNDIEEILACGKTDKEVENAAKIGQAVGEAVNATRELSNTPGGDMTPTKLAKAAKQAVAGLPVKVETFSRAQLEKMGMGALVGVGKGSPDGPTFTVLEYKGSSAAPIVLAGKGITFDSGGLNLKPSASIYEMHMDMSGASAVINTVALAARLKLKKHVIGLIPAAENMPGANAYRPGDILKSLSGKTIEVLDTDAEGRIVLADALTYAKRFRPAVVIDIATLTGAVLIALGLQASGLLTRDDKLAKTLEEVGEESGDYLWRFPMWDEYEESVKGTFGDVANVPGGATSRYGGVINGGMFLWQFAKELGVPWAHLDIASRMTAAPGDELSKGAAGAPVRLLIRFIEQWS